MSHRTDKRKRLIDAAKNLIRRQGFNMTTLADIADESEVPLGNVYYYFKTKDAIGESVLGDIFEELKNNLNQWSKEPHSAARLIAHLDHVAAQSKQLVCFGCQIGSLCQELSKQDGFLSQKANDILAYLLEWVQNQFVTLGFKEEKSRQYALYYLSAIQGISLLGNSFKNPEYIKTVCETTRKWLLNLAASSQTNVDLPVDEIFA